MRRILAPALASGLLAGLAWYPDLCPWLIVVAFLPAWRQWFEEYHPRRVFLFAWLFISIATAIGSYWVGATVHRMWQFSPLNSTLILIAFSAISNIHVPIAAWVWAHLRNRVRMSRLSSLCLLGILLYFAELLFPRLFPTNFGYPWMWSGLPIRQLAGIVGFSGLSLLTFLLNACFLNCWILVSSGMARRGFAGIAATISAIVALNMAGSILERKWSHFDRELKIAFIQPNAPEHGHMRNIFGEQFKVHELQRLISLTRDLLDREGKPDVIIWPENSLLVKVNSPDPIVPKIQSFAKELGIPLMIGMQALAPDKKVYGSIATIDEGGQIKGVYNKVVLIPLGEYIPGATAFPFLNSLDRNNEQFTAGEGFETAVVEVHGARLGTMICYEALMPWIFNELSENGAEIFVNASNDIWFGNSVEPYQHGYMALARALEFRRPLIRVTTTGPSALALANGETQILGQSNQSKSGKVTVKFSSAPDVSFYHQFGAAIPFLVAVLTVLMCAWPLLRRAE